MDSRLNSIFEEAVTAKKIPGVAAIALDRAGNVLFKGTYGSTNLDDLAAPALTSRTPIMLWSCTKLVTSVAALQLLEQGKLHLEDPVEKYVPSIANIQVLDGFKPDGQPIIREPKTKATVLNLMTHTAGFSYDFFSKETLQWRTQVGQPPSEYAAVGAVKNFESPFNADPGTRYEYGVNTDWLGFVVEAISGMRLNEYVEKNILKPLGMNDSGSHVKEGASPLVIHLRGSEDGGLTAAPPIACATAPERFGGGHFLYSTLDDYSTFLLTILNNGTHPTSRTGILKAETVKEYLFKDQIPKICSNTGIGTVESANPVLTSEGEFLPGIQKGWSCGLLLNLEDSPKGRSAGSGSWAGLGNLYYWLDPNRGKLGLVMSGILPFMDKEILCLFDQMERAVYGHEPASASGEKGANYSVVPLPWHAK
jgi:methyl acetate hydrolase